MKVRLSLCVDSFFSLDRRTVTEVREHRRHVHQTKTGNCGTKFFIAGLTIYDTIP